MMEGNRARERLILEEEVKEKKEIVARYKRELAFLEESYGNKSSEAEKQRQAEAEEDKIIAELEEEAVKLTVDLENAQRQAARTEQLVGELNQLKEELSRVEKEKRERLVSEEISFTAEELKLLESIDLQKARNSDLRKQGDELAQKLNHLESLALESEENICRVECRKKAIEGQLEELEQKLQCERDGIEEADAKLASDSEVKPATSLYAEADEGRQDFTEEAREMYRAYKATKDEIAQIELQIRKVESDKQSASIGKHNTLLATLESAYGRRIQDLERILLKLSKNNESPPLEFLPNDLNADEFDLFHKILATKSKQTEEWKAEFGRVAQIEMNLSHEADRLKMKKQALLSEIAFLEAPKNQTVTVAPKVIRRVNFAPDEPLVTYYADEST